MLYPLVLLPIFFGVIEILFKKYDTRIPILIAQLGLLGYAVYIFLTVRSSGVVIDLMSGLPAGLAIRLYADILSSSMVLLNVTIFTVLLLFAYNKTYMTNKFLFLMLLLQGVVNSLFLSGDLFNLYVMLEVSTVTVSILIMIKKEKQAIYDGMIYFFVNVIGTAFLLFGIGMLYSTTGMLDMQAIQMILMEVNDPNVVLLPFALMMTTLSLKVAAVPLFSWLPKAHGTPSAPAVVSAALSGLYIKTGVYMFIRFTEMFSPLIDATDIFFIIGFITCFFGIIMAVAQTDMKMILAYSTVSQIGLIMVGLNLGVEIAFYGALFHILSHALFKTTLFLSAGQIADKYGTRNVNEIRGLFKVMPLTAIAVVLASLGIMGAPLFNGSVSKYMMSSGSYHTAYQIAMNLINIGTIVYFIKFCSILVGEEDKIKVKGDVAVDKFSEYVVLILSIGMIMTGVFGPTLVDALFNFSDLTLLTSSYLEKNIIFVFALVADYALYRSFSAQESFFQRYRHFEITFNGIITSMVAFFLFIYGVVYIFII